MENLPDELLDLILDFFVSEKAELKCASLLNIRLQRVSENSVVATMIYERDFKHNNDVLYRCILNARDERSTWEDRVKLYRKLKFSGSKDPMPRMSIATITCPEGLEDLPTTNMPQFHDIILYSDPSFHLNIGSIYSIMFVTGIRLDDYPSYNELRLKGFKLSTFRIGDHPPTPESLRSALIVVSVDGIPMSSFNSFDEFSSHVRRRKEFSRWRFMFCPSFDVFQSSSLVPWQCKMINVRRQVQYQHHVTWAEQEIRDTLTPVWFNRLWLRLKRKSFFMFGWFRSDVGTSANGVE